MVWEVGVVEGTGRGTDVEVGNSVELEKRNVFVRVGEESGGWRV